MDEHLVVLTVNWPAPRADDSAASPIRQAVAAGYIDTAKGSLDRAMKRVEFVTGAAGALGTLYTGVLAFRFSVGDKANPACIWGVAPAMLLGLSVVLGLGYRLFLPTGTHGKPLFPATDEEAVANFLTWTDTGVRTRAWLLNASVFALGAGVATTPAPFLAPAEADDFVSTVVFVALVGFASSVFLLRQPRAGAKTDSKGAPSVPKATSHTLVVTTPPPATE